MNRCRELCEEWSLTCAYCALCGEGHMLAAKKLVLVFFVLVGTASPGPRARTQQSSTPARNIPKTWDDEAIATLEIPLADPVGSPRHASADYYYRIPVAPIYKSYPVYVPGYEPTGFTGPPGVTARA